MVKKIAPISAKITAYISADSYGKLDEDREQITEVIEVADQDVLDLMRSRAREEDVLGMLDEPVTR